MDGEIRVMNSEEDSSKKNAVVPNAPDRDELFRHAVDAARAGNMRGVLNALQQSEVFDGYLRRLQSKWPALHEDDLSAVLWSEVVDSFYVAVRQGATIVNVAAWLWKTACNKTIDLHTDLRRAGTLQGHDPSAPEEDENAPPDDYEETRAKRVAKAIELAHGLIPKLGEQTVQDVMRYILDSYAAGQWEISNASIGAAVGLTAASVRMWRSRGFQRLIREAAKEREINPGFDVSQFVRDAEADEE